MTSQVMYDYTKAGLNVQNRAIADFAVKLTYVPWETEKTDVDDLRSVGLTDEQILSVVLITSVFAFMNRLMQGLGAEFSKHRQGAIEKWLVGEALNLDWLMTEES